MHATCCLCVTTESYCEVLWSTCSMPEPVDAAPEAERWLEAMEVDEGAVEEMHGTLEHAEQVRSNISPMSIYKSLTLNNSMLYSIQKLCAQQPLAFALLVDCLKRWLEATEQDKRAFEDMHGTWEQAEQVRRTLVFPGIYVLCCLVRWSR